MEKEDEIIMKKGELPEELANRINAKKGKIRRVLDESENVLRGWGYPQNIPDSIPREKLREAVMSGELKRGWGYPQDIPSITPSQK